MSITGIKGIIKALFQDLRGGLWAPFIIVMTACGAFALGRFSALPEGSFRIEQKNLLQASVVASEKGTRYHFPWCAGAQSISEENKLWFDSAKEARQAGYEGALNCKGLEP